MTTDPGTSESVIDTVQEQTPSSTYSAKNIKLLDGIEHVRTRPDMYIGSRGDEGLQHLLSEVVDNSIDEVANGYATFVRVTLLADGSVVVIDDGRGIPVDIHEDTGRPAVEIVMTKLYAGGKFDNYTYKASAGLHGVGVSVVNALSQWLEVEISRHGKLHYQRYEQGAPACDMEIRGETEKTGTQVTFLPDGSIFGDSEFKYESIARRLRELAYLNPDARIELCDERTAKEEVFQYPAGLVDYIKHANKNKEVLHTEVITSKQEQDNVIIEFALQYNDHYDENIHSFANNVNTRFGGTHLSGFKSALTRSFNNYAKSRLKEKAEKLPSGDDYREGLCATISVKLPNPQFESQTKIRLVNAEIEGLVNSYVYSALETWCEEHPNDLRAIMDKARKAREARIAARRARDLARERKSALSGGNLPTKLSDCTSRDVEKSELFLVEGDSAGGSAKRGRNPEFQAILPLRGKILNAEKASIDKVLSFQEIKMIVSALGAGVHTDFDVDRCRYGKVIIMCDADVDGSHIRTLLLTFFYRQMRPLVQEGRVYAALPPLYQTKKKKKIEYILDDREFKQRMLSLGIEGTRLEDTTTGVSVAGDGLAQLVDVLIKLEDQAQIVGRKGLSFDVYLRSRRDDGALPYARLALGKEGSRLLYSAEEEAEFLERRREENSELVVCLDSDPLEERSKADIIIGHFSNKREIEKQLLLIEESGFDPQSYLEAEIAVEAKARGEEPEPRFQFFGETSDSSPLGSLRDLPDAIRSLGQKGLEVKRFKGLGEMNYQELWETTMDPERRTLQRIKEDDYEVADQMFAVLMGEAVEPRRDFIERHALEVKNLDT